MISIQKNEDSGIRMMTQYMDVSDFKEIKVFFSPRMILGPRHNPRLKVFTYLMLEVNERSRVISVALYGGTSKETVVTQL